MTSELKRRRDELLGAGAHLFYDDPVHLVRGSGVDLWDADGHHYLDLYNNVPCVGHAHPRVVEAVSRQTAELVTHSRYLNADVLDYAERLLGLHHDGLESAIFACSGSEAIDVAIQLARTVTGKSGILVTDAAYHGNTTQVSRLTYRHRLDPDGGVYGVPFPQTYRSVEGASDDDALRDFYLRSIDEGIEALASAGAGLAAFVFCPIFANEGLPNLPQGFLDAARRKVHEAGGLLVVDEVQAGFCRTGRFWGYETMGVVPDVVVMGKPMAAGVPLSGIVASRQRVESFRQATRYFNTFASGPLQAAAGDAVLSVLLEERLAANAQAVGLRLDAGLRELQSRCEAMGDVRSRGLFVGAEWVRDRESKEPDVEGVVAVVNALRHKGFLLSNAGAHSNVLKIRPPLPFTADHADRFLEALEEVLRETDHLA